MIKKIKVFELNKIYNRKIDLEFLKTIPSDSMNIIIDPPYEIGINKQGFVKDTKKRYKAPKGKKSKFVPNTEYPEDCLNWDKQPSAEEFQEILRISRKIVIFGGNYFTHKLPQSGYWLVWDKRVKDNYKNDFSDCELIWTNFKGNNCKKYNHIWFGFIQQDMKNKEKRYHPTQKPVKLIKDIIIDFLEDDYPICDFYMGSGSTAVACQELEIDFLGFEMNKTYCSIANKRLKQENKKLNNWFNN